MHPHPQSLKNDEPFYPYYESYKCVRFFQLVNIVKNYICVAFFELFICQHLSLKGGE